MTDVETQPAPLSREAKIEAAVAKYGDTARWCWDVYSIDPNNRRSKFVGRVHGLDFDEAEFGLRVGPGDYERGLRVEGAGRVPQIIVERFSIDARIGTVMQGTAKADASPGLEGVLAKLMDRLDAMERRIVEPPAHPQTASVVTMMKDLAEAMRAMQPPQPATGPTWKDMMEVMGKRSTASELVELMEVTKKIGGDIGGGSSDDGMGAMATAFGKFLDKIPDPTATPHVVQVQKPAGQALPAPASPAAVTPPPPKPQPKKQPFPGAERTAAALKQIPPGFELSAEQLEDAIESFNEEIEYAGGSPEDVASRYDAPGLVKAMLDFEPGLQPNEAILHRLADAFFAGFTDDERDQT